eukprot:1546260-Pleurochrysis_carterae.AAC.4
MTFTLLLYAMRRRACTAITSAACCWATQSQGRHCQGRDNNFNQCTNDAGKRLTLTPFRFQASG